MAKYTNTIEYKLKTTIDNSGITQLKSQLSSVQNEFKKISLNNPFTQDMSKDAVNSIEKIKKAYTQAFDPTTGLLNLQKLQQGLNGISLAKLQQQFSYLGAASKNTFNSMIGSFAKVETGVKTMSASMDKFINTLGNTARWGISASLIQTMSNRLYDAVQYVKDLDRSLNDIRIVTGLSAENMRDFTFQANEAAKALGQTTVGFTNASLIFAQQGYSIKASADLAALTLKTANVTGQETAEVSEQLTSLLNGFQINGNDIAAATAAVDKLAKVAAVGAADLEELATAESKVASTANTLGVSQDQLVAQLSTIISVTRQAPENVGNAMKTIYARLGDLRMGETLEDGTDLGQIGVTLEKIGVSLLDTTGNMRNMGDVIEDLMDKWDGLNTAEKQAVAVKLAGKYQYNNLLALLENSKMYNEQLQASYSSLGTINEQQEIYMESLEGKTQSLQSAFEGLISTIADPDVFKPLISGLTDLVEIVDQFVNGIGGIGPALGAAFSLFLSKGSNTIGRNFASSLYNANVDFQVAQNERAVMSTLLNERGLGRDDIGVASTVDYVRQNARFLGIMDEAQREQYNRDVDTRVDLASQYNSILEERNMAASAVTTFFQEVGLMEDGKEYRNKDSLNLNSIRTLIGQDPKEFDFIKNWGTVTEAASKKRADASNILSKMFTSKGRIHKDNFDADEIRQLIPSMSLSQKDTERLEGYLNTINRGISDATVRGSIDYRDAVAGLNREVTTFHERMEKLQSSKPDEVMERLGSATTRLEEAQEGINSANTESKARALNLAIQQQTAGLTQAAGAAASLAVAFMSLKNIGSIWTNEDLDTSEKFLQTLENMVFVLPMLISGFSDLAGAKQVLLASKASREELIAAGALGGIGVQGWFGTNAGAKSGSERVQNSKAANAQNTGSDTNQNQTPRRRVALSKPGTNLQYRSTQSSARAVQAARERRAAREAQQEVPGRESVQDVMTQSRASIISSAIMGVVESIMLTAMNPVFLGAIIAGAVVMAINGAIKDAGKQIEKQQWEDTVEATTEAMEKANRKEQLVNELTPLYDEYKATGNASQAYIESLRVIGEEFEISETSALLAAGAYDELNQKIVENMEAEKEAARQAAIKQYEEAKRIFEKQDIETDTGLSLFDKIKIWAFQTFENIKKWLTGVKDWWDTAFADLDTWWENASTDFDTFISKMLELPGLFLIELSKLIPDIKIPGTEKTVGQIVEEWEELNTIVGKNGEIWIDRITGGVDEKHGDGNGSVFDEWEQEKIDKDQERARQGSENAKTYSAEESLSLVGKAYDLLNAGDFHGAKEVVEEAFDVQAKVYQEMIDEGYTQEEAAQYAAEVAGMVSSALGEINEAMTRLAENASIAANETVVSINKLIDSGGDYDIERYFYDVTTAYYNELMSTTGGEQSAKNDAFFGEYTLEQLVGGDMTLEEFNDIIDDSIYAYASMLQNASASFIDVKTDDDFIIKWFETVTSNKPHWWDPIAEWWNNRPVVTGGKVTGMSVETNDQNTETQDETTVTATGEHNYDYEASSRPSISTSTHTYADSQSSESSSSAGDYHDDYAYSSDPYVHTPSSSEDVSQEVEEPDFGSPNFEYEYDSSGKVIKMTDLRTGEYYVYTDDMGWIKYSNIYDNNGNIIGRKNHTQNLFDLNTAPVGIGVSWKSLPEGSDFYTEYASFKGIETFDGSNIEFENPNLQYFYDNDRNVIGIYDKSTGIYYIKNKSTGKWVSIANAGDEWDFYGLYASENNIDRHLPSNSENTGSAALIDYQFDKYAEQKLHEIDNDPYGVSNIVFRQGTDSGEISGIYNKTTGHNITQLVNALAPILSSERYGEIPLPFGDGVKKISEITEADLYKMFGGTNTEAMDTFLHYLLSVATYDLPEELKSWSETYIPHIVEKVVGWEWTTASKESAYRHMSRAGSSKPRKLTTSAHDGSTPPMSTMANVTYGGSMPGGSSQPDETTEATETVADEVQETNELLKLIENTVSDSWIDKTQQKEIEDAVVLAMLSSEDETIRTLAETYGQYIGTDAEKFIPKDPTDYAGYANFMEQFSNFMYDFLQNNKLNNEEYVAAYTLAEKYIQLSEDISSEEGYAEMMAALEQVAGYEAGMFKMESGSSTAQLMSSLLGNEYFASYLKNVLGNDMEAFVSWMISSVEDGFTKELLKLEEEQRRVESMYSQGDEYGQYSEANAFTKYLESGSGLSLDAQKTILGSINSSTNIDALAAYVREGIDRGYSESELTQMMSYVDFTLPITTDNETLIQSINDDITRAEREGQLVEIKLRASIAEYEQGAMTLDAAYIGNKEMTQENVAGAMDPEIAQIFANASGQSRSVADAFGLIARNTIEAQTAARELAHEYAVMGQTVQALDMIQLNNDIAEQRAYWYETRDAVIDYSDGIETLVDKYDLATAMSMAAESAEEAEEAIATQTEALEKLVQLSDELEDVSWEMDVNMFGDALDYAESLRGTIEDINDVAALMDENFQVDPDNFTRLIEMFPQLINGFTILENGKIQMDQNMAASAIETARIEVQADAQAQAEKLLAQADYFDYMADTYQRQVEIIDTAISTGLMTEEHAAMLKVKTENNVASKKEEALGKIDDASFTTSENEVTYATTTAEQISSASSQAATNVSYNLSQMSSNAAKSFNEIIMNAKATFDSVSSIGSDTFLGKPNLTGGTQWATNTKTAVTVDGVTNKDNATVGDVTYDQTPGSGNDELQALKNDYLVKIEALRGMSVSAKAEAARVIAKSMGAGIKDAEKGGSGGGGGKLDTKEAKDLDLDRYEKVDTVLDSIKSNLDKIETIQEDLVGQGKIESIKNEIDLYRQQIPVLEEKKNIQLEELEEMRKKLEDLGIEFGEDGFIQNYQDTYMKMYEEYLLYVEMYNSATDEALREALATTIEDFEKNLDDLNDTVSEYDDMIAKEIPETEKEILESMEKIEEAGFEIFNVFIEGIEDLHELNKTMSEFDGIMTGLEKDNPFRALIASASLFDKTVSSGSLEQMKALGEELASQADLLANGDASGWVGDDNAQFLETTQKYMSGLVDEINRYQEAAKEIEDNVIESMEYQAELMDERIEKYDHINEQLEHQQKIIEMMHGEDAYQELNQVYDAMATANTAKMMELKAKEYQFQQLADSYADKDSESYKKAMELVYETQSEIDSLVEESIELTQQKFENMINETTDKFAESLVGSSDLEWMQEEWELIGRNAEQYLDAVNSAYEVQKLQGRYVQMLDYATDPGIQREITKQMNEQLAILREKDKLSQYDVDYANAQLEILQKRIALEDAQRNKNQMRLKRDAQGNYSYVYTADENAIAEAQQAFADAENNAYNLSKENIITQQENAMSAISSANSLIRDIMNNRSLNDTEREERVNSVYESLREYLGGISEQLSTSESNIIQDYIDAIDSIDPANRGKGLLGDVFGVDKRFDTELSDRLQALEMASYKESELYAGLTAAQEEWNNKSSEILESAGDDFASFGENINSAYESVDALVGGMSDFFNEISKNNQQLIESQARVDEYTVSLEGLTDIMGRLYDYASGEYKEYIKMNIHNTFNGDKPGDPDKFDTGGYTGNWSGGSGKLAVLHSKEIVLNAEDTANILKTVEMVREMTNSMKQGVFEAFGSSMFDSVHSKADSDADVSVCINAEFPNAYSAEEIKGAFMDLNEQAIQYLYKNR